MIITEFYRERTDGVKLYRTYSDMGYLIRQTETGVEYTEAIDIENAPYTYEETGRLPEYMTQSVMDTEALSIITGGEQV